MDKLYRLTAFPKTAGGGNKAGVYLDADNLSEARMQKIAKEVGYSETAFVTESDRADFRVRFFTPVSEVDLCGHATIATFNLLRDLGRIVPGEYTQETKAGILRLSVREKRVFMEQIPPFFGSTVSRSELAACFIGLEFAYDLEPRIVSTGLREIFIPVKSREALFQLQPDFDKIIDLCRKYDTIGMHVFALDVEADAYSRNFCPLVGVNEESATGTSNGALGCYLFAYHEPKRQYVLRQGYNMGLPSEIITRLEISDQKITGVWVGGTARIINN